MLTYPLIPSDPAPHASGGRAAQDSQCRERSAAVANGPRGLMLKDRLLGAGRLAGAATLFALFLAAIGAHDTDAAHWPQRIRYWLLMAGMSALVLAASNLWFRRRWPSGSALFRGVAVLAFLWLPLILFAMFLCIFLFGGSPSFARLLALIAPMGSVVAGLQLLLSPTFASKVVAAEPQISVAEPTERLLDRTPLPHRHARLLAVEAEDHYVRIHTESGSTLLRMRFRDAIAMLPPDSGVRTHRSWWVMRDAVRQVRRNRKGAVVTLLDGRQVPVSRTASRALLGTRSSSG